MPKRRKRRTRRKKFRVSGYAANNPYYVYATSKGNAIKKWAKRSIHKIKSWELEEV